MSKASRFISSSSPGKSKPTRLDFKSGWNVGPVFDWYNRLTDPRAKSIEAIQIRKDVSGPVPHRFIVLRMCDKLVHRFDRRPDHGPNADTTPVGLIFNQAVASEDSYMCGITLEEEEKCSECEIELTLKGQVDLITVISVCYAISVDGLAQKYTFLRHNCFFFSWTILTIVSRHHLPYERPSLESLLLRFDSEFDRITSLVVDEITTLFLDLGIETFIIFLCKVRESAPEGLGLAMGRAGWMFPTGVVRFLGRRAFKLHLYFALRSRLTKMIKAELTRGASIMQELALERSNLTRTLLDKHLWVEGTKGAVKEKLLEEGLKILWKGLLEAISGGLGTVKPEHLQDQLTNPQLNFTWLGQGVAELCTVCSAMLQGGLAAVGEVAQDVEGLSHDDAFTKACNAAQGAALAAAKNAVKATREVLQKPERDAKWAAIWGIWDGCCDEAREAARPKVMETLERVIKEILDATTEALVQAGWKCLGVRHSQKLEFTNAQLQEHMQGIIRGNTAGASYLDDVQSSMERVWEKACQHLPLPVPAALLDKIAELGPEIAH